MVKFALNVMLPSMLMAIMHCVASWGGGGGDVISPHNRLRDIFNEFCHSACLAPQLEVGGWSREHTRPADVLVPNWVLGKPAAFDLSVTSTLNAQIFQEACVTAGSAALAAQIRKHRVNDENVQGTRLGRYPSCGGDIRMLGY